jgi:mRNA-degrading endonuclease toxin of MazEF toxin-antitoxin module
MRRRDGVDYCPLATLKHLQCTVAEVSTSIRGIGAEVEFDYEQAGLDRSSVVNCDGVHTITKTSLTTCVGSVSEATMARVCSAIGYALGC